MTTEIMARRWPCGCVELLDSEGQQGWVYLIHGGHCSDGIPEDWRPATNEEIEDAA